MDVSQQEIAAALTLVDASLTNCENAQRRLKEGTASHSLSVHRIKALRIARALLLHETRAFTPDELAAAHVQLLSIRSKSETGLAHAQPGSGTHTRFSRIIAAMNTVLIHLDAAMEAHA